MADSSTSYLPLPIRLFGEVAQWQSRGLISPWLQVQIPPSPLEKSDNRIKTDRLSLNWEPVCMLASDARSFDTD